jgi:MFS family permease
VFRSYRAVLSVPGAPAFTAAGLISRLPLSMLGIGIVLLVESGTGSYGLAGSVAGVFGLTQAVTSPVVARLVDRYGQARVMLPAIAVHVLGLVLLVVGAQAGAPDWALYAAGVIAGATIGSLGALVRARWSHVLEGHESEAGLLHTAYSWESVLDEVVFITGPILVTLLATRLDPGFGVLAAAVAVATGGSALMLQRGTEPPPSGRRARAGEGVLRSAGMIVLLLGMACAGLIFGSVEVLAVAFADEQGHRGLTGGVLATWAFGSLLAGLAYGAVQWRVPAGRRFLLAVLVLAAGVAPLLLVQSLPQLAGFLFVAGFAISPMIIGGNGVVQELVAPSRLTEGLTWVASAIGVGMAVGAAIAGAAVDAFGAQRAFAVPVYSGAVAAAIVLAGARWLRPGADRLRKPVPAQA